MKLETWLFEWNIKFVIFKPSVNKMTIEVGSPEREVDLFKLNSYGPCCSMSRVGSMGRFHNQGRKVGSKILETVFFICVGGQGQFSIVASKFREKLHNHLEGCPNNLWRMFWMTECSIMFHCAKGFLFFFDLVVVKQESQFTVSLQHLRPCFHSVCAACLQCLSSNSEGDAFDCPRCGRRTQKMSLGLRRSAFCLDRDVWLNPPQLLVWTCIDL